MRARCHPASPIGSAPCTTQHDTCKTEHDYCDVRGQSRLGVHAYKRKVCLSYVLEQLLYLADKALPEVAGHRFVCHQSIVSAAERAAGSKHDWRAAALQQHVLPWLQVFRVACFLSGDCSTLLWQARPARWM